MAPPLRGDQHVIPQVDIRHGKFAVNSFFRYRQDPRMRNITLSKMRRNRKPWSDPVTDKTADPVKLSQIMSLPEADTRLVIMFTPRSGSSRLTDLFKDTKTLGTPGEFFNPGFVPGIANAFGASDLDEYCAAVLRKRVARGTFSVEVTYRQMLRTFGSEERFVGHLRPTHWAWLIREDIVAQAVSSSRQIQTRVAHNTGLSSDVLDAAEKKFVYDGPDIRKQLLSIRMNELETETMFRRFGIRPLRLSYERLSLLKGPEITSRVADFMGLTLPKTVAYREVHKKIGTDKNLDFARRFRKEFRWLVLSTELSRRRMLRRLDD